MQLVCHDFSPKMKGGGWRQFYSPFSLRNFRTVSRATPWVRAMAAALMPLRRMVAMSAAWASRVGLVEVLPTGRPSFMPSDFLRASDALVRSEIISLSILAPRLRAKNMTSEPMSSFSSRFDFTATSLAFRFITLAQVSMTSRERRPRRETSATARVSPG